MLPRQHISAATGKRFSEKNRDTDLLADLRSDELADIAAFANVMSADAAAKVKANEELKKKERMKKEMGRIQRAAEAARARAEAGGTQADTDSSITRVDYDPQDTWSP